MAIDTSVDAALHRDRLAEPMVSDTTGAELGYAATARTRLDHLALIEDPGDGPTRTSTYAELDARSSRLAHALTSVGLTSGQPLGIMLPNSLEFFECLAASAKVGSIALTVNWHLAADELGWVLADSGATVLVAHRSLAPQVEAARAQAPGCTVLYVPDDYEAALGAASDAPVAYQWPTPWPMLYTSGTTGRPKGVVHGASPDPAIMHLAQQGLVALWGYRADDVHLLAGPAYHAGPSGYANTTHYVGGTVVVLPAWDARAALAVIERHRVTTTFLTPAHLIRLLEVPAEERAGFDTSSFRQVIHAGAPCPVTVKQRFLDAFPATQVWELYGASEGGATRIGPDDWRAKPGSVGTSWPGVEIRIVDQHDGSELGTGDTGIIYVKPQHSRFHYHNDPEKTAGAWRDDAFTVGDIGHLDADGHLFITDRVSDMVIKAGVNIYPRQIEDVLYRHRDVVDCAVFGIPDERDGEHLRAVVEVRRPVPAADIQAWCQQHLDGFTCPDEIVFVAELPRDPNGKVLKRRLREAAWADRPTSI